MTNYADLLRFISNVGGDKETGKNYGAEEEGGSLGTPLVCLFPSL